MRLFLRRVITICRGSSLVTQVTLLCEFWHHSPPMRAVLFNASGVQPPGLLRSVVHVWMPRFNRLQYTG